MLLTKVWIKSLFLSCSLRHMKYDCQSIASSHASCTLVQAPNQSVYPWGNTQPLVMLPLYHVLKFWQGLLLFFMFTYFLASFGHWLFHAKCRIIHFSTIEILVKSHQIYITIWEDWCTCNNKPLHVGSGNFLSIFLALCIPSISS